MKQFLILFLIVILIDSIYLNTIKTPFATMIESIQKTDINLRFYSILLCYFLVCTCIYYFLWKKNATYNEAFLLGLIIYGVFDTTSYALFRDWDVTLAIIDSLWGGILFSATLYVMNHFISLH